MNTEYWQPCTARYFSFSFDQTLIRYYSFVSELTHIISFSISSSYFIILNMRYLSTNLFKYLTNYTVWIGNCLNSISFGVKETKMNTFWYYYAIMSDLFMFGHFLMRLCTNGGHQKITLDYREGGLGGKKKDYLETSSQVPLLSK